MVEVVDLPGCYSLAARSPEEQIAHDVLLGELEGEERPDLVVVVVDASNLQRNLFLTSQLRDLGLPLVVALNMMDIAHERGCEICTDKLAATLGCPGGAADCPQGRRHRRVAGHHGKRSRLRLSANCRALSTRCRPRWKSR